MKRLSAWFIAPLALGLMALLPAPGRAGSISYGATGTSGGQTVNAQADFTTSAGQITIKLTNLLAPSSIVSSSQGISGITFTLSNNAGALGTTTASGQQGNLSGPITSPPPRGAIVTDVAGTPGRFIGVGGGTFTTSAGSPIIIMSALGGGQPSQLILPFVANGGAYPNANQGVFGGQFNPFTIGPATFTLNLAGVNVNTTVTAASFTFGTPDATIPGTLVVVPEPSTAILALVGIGFASLTWARKCRAQARAA